MPKQLLQSYICALTRERSSKLATLPLLSHATSIVLFRSLVEGTRACSPGFTALADTWLGSAEPRVVPTISTCKIARYTSFCRAQQDALRHCVRDVGGEFRQYDLACPRRSLPRRLLPENP